MEFLDALVQAGFKVTIQYFWDHGGYGVHVFPLDSEADSQGKESYDIIANDLNDALCTAVKAILGTRVKSGEDK